VTNKVRIDGVVINPDDEPLITTASGLYVNPLDLKPELVRVEDIAHSLGNLCRYTGHTKYHYSVAQHSIYVSKLVPEELAFPALFHDAQEFVLNDVSRPIKYDEYYGKAIRGAQKRSEAVINQALGIELSHEDHMLIKAADVAMLALERDTLLPPGAVWEIVEGIERPTNITITEWSPKQARQRFMARYKEVADLG
jgi:5'-nucleotidase